MSPRRVGGRRLRVGMSLRAPERAGPLAQHLRVRDHEVLLADPAEATLPEELDVLVVEIATGDDTAAFELIEERLTNRPDTRVVLLGDDPGFGACRRAWKLGVTDFLAHPVSPYELVHLVERPDDDPAATGRRARLLARFVAGLDGLDPRAAHRLLGSLRAGDAPGALEAAPALTETLSALLAKDGPRPTALAE